MLEIDLSDDVLAWELAADGAWHKIPTLVGTSTHRVLQELAVARSHSA
jgi:hypothetical protein